jgi:hypothetical protein
MLPKVEEAHYLDKLNKVLIFIDEQRPTQRELREFMQEEEMWDKELLGPDFWDFHQIIREKRYKLGKLASKMLDNRREPAVEKELLFRHILRENELLSKYIFDALNERLHSDAELYRYMTSYVYPGQKIRRPDFLSWLKLVTILGYIRIIGIRYGLTDAGKDAMRWIDQIDVESLLEEERQEEAGEGEDEDEDDEEELAQAVIKATARKPAQAKDEDEDEDEDGDEPGADDAGDEEAPARGSAATDEDEDALTARLAASLGHPSSTPARPTAADAADVDDAPAPPPASAGDDADDDEAARRRFRRRPEPPPLQAAARAKPAPAQPPASSTPAVAPLVVAEEPAPPAAELAVRQPSRRPPSPRELPFGPTQLAENLERLTTWWADFDGRQLRHATDFGLSPLEHELAPQDFLLKLVSLATLVIGDPREADRAGFVNRLDRVRFFPRLMADGGALYPLLLELGHFDDDGGHRLLGENLLTLLRHRERLAAQPDLPARLAALTSGEELLTLLRTVFFDGLPGCEPHWVVREMVLLGLWKAAELRGVAAVPQRPARQAAYRLGLLATAHAGSARELLDAARRIAAVLGPETAFDEPLAHLGRALGCRAACPHVDECPYHCREKLDLP